jgi:hypothetical protein
MVPGTLPRRSLHRAKNPLDDIWNTEAIRMVMKNGRLFQGDDLQEIWPRQRALPCSVGERKCQTKGADGGGGRAKRGTVGHVTKFQRHKAGRRYHPRLRITPVERDARPVRRTPPCSAGCEPHGAAPTAAAGEPPRWSRGRARNRGGPRPADGRARRHCSGATFRRTMRRWCPS